MSNGKIELSSKEEKMKREAIYRINLLVDKFNLNPNVLKYFKEGKIYYSYLTAGGFMGSIDSVSYDSRYETFIKEYKEKTGNLPYHAIETGNTLALLYVGWYPELDEDELMEEWKYQRISDEGWVYCLVKNFSDDSHFSIEYGEIQLDRFEESGALVRIG